MYVCEILRKASYKDIKVISKKLDGAFFRSRLCKCPKLNILKHTVHKHKVSKPLFYSSEVTAMYRKGLQTSAHHNWVNDKGGMPEKKIKIVQFFHLFCNAVILRKNWFFSFFWTTGKVRTFLKHNCISFCSIHVHFVQDRG